MSGTPLVLAPTRPAACQFGVSLLNVRLNIGHRHMLALYPVLFVLAGGAAAWATRRAADSISATLAAAG